MAVEVTPKSARVAMLLNNGVSPTGAVKTVSLNIGSLNANYTPATDDEKALAIIDVICEVISKSLYRVNRVLTSEIATE